MGAENTQPTDDEILAGHKEAPAPGAESKPAVAPTASPESEFDSKPWGYKFRDQTVYPKDRNDMIELLQLGHSYRENKPKWEQDRQSLAAYEQKKDTYRQYDQLSAVLESNPDFRNELQQLALKYSQPKTNSQPNQTASVLPPEVEEKLREFSQWKERMEEERSDNELKLELDALEKSEPTYDWKTDSGEGLLRTRLLKYMQQNRVTKPEIAFAAMMRKEDIQNAKMAAAKAAADEAAKARKAGVVTPGSSPVVPNANNGIDHSKHSYAELEEMAVGSLGR